MKRLYVLAEGQAEEGFINRILGPHFQRFNLIVHPVVLITRKDRRQGRVYRGGATSYARIQTDLRNQLHACKIGEVWLTTMLDLYALPADFPGNNTPSAADPYRRVESLEQALADAWKEHPKHPCLVPYIQLHEFEALLLSDVEKFDWEFIEPEEVEGIARLKGIAEERISPEEIDDGELTAPSKRIIECLPGYANKKASSGPIIAEKIGIDVMRLKCPHFDQWIRRLEGLATPEEDEV